MSSSDSMMRPVFPILGYVLAIAVILVLAGIGFMATVSANLTSAAQNMAQILILVALMVGIASVTYVARRVGGR